MSRDVRVGTARALQTADLSGVTGIRRASLPTQVDHSRMGPSELAVKRAAAKVPPVKPKRTRRKKVDA